MVDHDGDVVEHERTSWGQRVSAHISDLQSQVNWIKEGGNLSQQDQQFIEKANTQLRTARETLRQESFWSRFNGRSIDRALANVHEAEVAILRVLPESQFKWKGLPVLVHARLHLDPSDARLQQLEWHLQLPNGRIKQLNGDDRELLASTLHAAYQAEESERARIRNFTQIVCAAAVIMTAIAVTFSIWALLDSDIPPRFCFPENPDRPESPLAVCPLGRNASWEGVWFIQFAGMLAAAVAGAVSLRKVRGTAGPYHVVTSLLLLRLPVGALAAVIGILLMSGRFFPGLTALDTPSQVVAWAAAFGILQETITHTVDRQGQYLLDNVRAPGRELESRPSRSRRGSTGVRRTFDGN
ncbi:hypothetical protein [Streptomyces massasporeus]|uniref:hypothetical protein n=1 Tax=Streptomyces massasporeus TaxID=67324 RepID=UPI0033F0AA8E